MEVFERQKFTGCGSRDPLLRAVRELPGEVFVMRAQRELRALGGTQQDAEELAYIAENEGYGKPLSELSRRRIVRLFNQVQMRCHSQQAVLG
jgi:hypothetical protein